MHVDVVKETRLFTVSVLPLLFPTPGIKKNFAVLVNRDYTINYFHNLALTETDKAVRETFVEAFHNVIWVLRTQLHNDLENGKVIEVVALILETCEIQLYIKRTVRLLTSISVVLNGPS
ncbi:hypothetical protein DGG96_03690 [Legionella qingyii]|uniref:Uncharacterized protein n=1 Tax=Legionella qingyii TaxID=2184757 RepID=A0A317U671_9GAMM|nr:hypothetical protein DGG96_03690 [Legionella qingyii]